MTTNRLLFALLAFLGGSTAFADARQDALELYRQGTRDYDLGHYADAAHAYEEAFKIKEDPTLLFDIAQAYRLAGSYDRALAAYRGYLRRVPEASNRDELRQRILECEQARQRVVPKAPPAGEAAPAKPPVEAAPPPAAAAAPTPPRASPTVAGGGAAPAPRAAETRPGRGKKIAGLVCAAVGVAAIAVGATYLGLAAKAGDDLTSLDQKHQMFDSATQASGKSDQLLGAVMLGVGAAAAAAGITVFVIGRHESHARARLALAPLVGAHLAGTVVEARF